VAEASPSRALLSIEHALYFLPARSNSHVHATRCSSNSPCLPIEITLGSRGRLGVTRREPPIRGAIGRIGPMVVVVVPAPVVVVVLLMVVVVAAAAAAAAAATAAAAAAAVAAAVTLSTRLYRTPCTVTLCSSSRTRLALRARDRIVEAGRLGCLPRDESARDRRSRG